MRTKLMQTLAVSLAAGVVSCSGSKTPSDAGPDAGRGGASSTDDDAAITGGVSGSAAGGSVASGGAGGGRHLGSGGRASGGRTGSGGTSGSGTGSSGTGTGGAAAAGTGAADAGSTTASCNKGTTHTGGTQYCSNVDGNTGGYSYDLWSNGQGSGCMTVFGQDATFSSSWTNVGDFLTRVGLRWNESKTYDQLGTISSDFALTKSIDSGIAFIGIYGWSVNPLIEYYIVEDWVGSRPALGSQIGTFTIAGEGTYDVWKNTQVDQPNISGTNATFNQFWSVRQEPRECGHISISQHFQQWASMGLQLGMMEEARLLVEAVNNSGSIEFTNATVVVN